MNRHFIKVETEVSFTLQVEAPDPTGGGQEQEMVGGDQQVTSLLLRSLVLFYRNDANITLYQHVGHRWSSSLSRSQKRLKWREVKKVVDPQAPAARTWKFKIQMVVCCAGADDDDEARSEATFRFRVENFSTIKDSTLSESCVIR